MTEEREMDYVHLKLIDLAGIEKIPPGVDYVKMTEGKGIWTAAFEAPEIYNTAHKSQMKVG
jgi:hypothetical protein